MATPKKPEAPTPAHGNVFEKTVLAKLAHIEKQLDAQSKELKQLDENDKRIIASVRLLHNKADSIGEQLTTLSKEIQQLDNKIDLLIVKVDECCKDEHPPPTGVGIQQLGDKGEPMPITGINVGSTEGFGAFPLPEGTQFPSGTVDTWTASDPSITLAPADPNDPSEAAVLVSVPADSTLTTFDLSVSSQMPADSGGNVPAPLTATVSVPVIAAPVPLPTGVFIDQLPKATPLRARR
jgi:hypothetical protein